MTMVASKLRAVLYRRVSRDTSILALLAAVIISVNVVSYVYLKSLADENPHAPPYPVIAGDSVHYAHWADNLLALHAYQDVPGVPLRAAPPGYPFLLALFKAITGSIVPVVAVQVMLTLLAAALIYTMACEIVPWQYAVGAAMAYGLDPMVILTDTTILTDALFSSLIVCIIYLAFFQTRLRGALRWGLAGFLLGLALMLRPIGEFLLLVLPAAYLYKEWLTGVHADGSRIQALCAFVLGCALVIAPWMARNDAVFNSIELSPLGGHNLMTFDVRGFLAWRALADSAHPLPAFLVLRHENDPVFAIVDRHIAADLSGITPKGQDTQSYEGTLALRYILQDPLRYLYFDLVNTLPFFFSSSFASYGQIVSQLRDNTGFFAPVSLSLANSIGELRHPHSIRTVLSAVGSLAPTVLEILWWLLVTAMACLGLFVRRREFLIVILAGMVAYFALLTGPMSNSRYRIPAEPYLLILAATGLYGGQTAVREHIAGRRRTG